MSKLIALVATAVVVGAVLYRVVIQLALQVGLNPNDMKLISAVLVVVALVLPRWAPLRHWRAKRRARHESAIPEEVSVDA